MQDRKIITEKIYIHMLMNFLVGMIGFSKASILFFIQSKIRLHIELFLTVTSIKRFALKPLLGLITSFETVESNDDDAKRYFLFGILIT